VLRAAPAASLVGLFAWAALDVAAVRVPGWNATLAGLLGAAGVLSLVGWIPRGRPVAWLGLVGRPRLGLRLTLLDALAELRGRATHGAGELGELLGPEQEDDDPEDDQELGPSYADCDHVLHLPRVRTPV